MTLLTFDLKYCPACHGERPHSRRGKCQSCWTRRTKPMRQGRLRYERTSEERGRWAMTKQKVYDRDGWTCQRCGQRMSPRVVLDVHHRIPRGSGGTSRDEAEYGLANLITVCRADHMWAEQFRLDAMDTGWLITRFGDVDPATVPILTVRGWELLAGDGTRRGVEP